MTQFGPLSELRERPIGAVTEIRARRGGYRAYPIARSNTLHGEPMVELKSLGLAGENYYHARRNPPYWQRIEGSIPALLARSSVAQRLVRVDARLRSAGLQLHLFDAWRPKAVQAYFHDVWMPAELRRRNPSLTGDALTAEVERYWAAPSRDADSPAPHATGAAIDLTIRWIDGDALWMGSLFDDATPLAHRDRFEALGDGDLSFSDEEARANRRLLHWLMIEEGFAGHPDEWWHYSWGDQLWAALTGADAAHYGEASDGV
ncbi:MAG: peptidase M15D vanX D-ala-D-ala dipeptidase [Proteobacteria bacterium]|nr:peptidase M15D vanX D-ala-D-ala dipeptidase [Pseudomonadota bacterium]